MIDQKKHTLGGMQSELEPQPLPLVDRIHQQRYNTNKPKNGYSLLELACLKRETVIRPPFYLFKHVQRDRKAIYKPLALHSYPVAVHVHLVAHSVHKGASGLVGLLPALVVVAQAGPSIVSGSSLLAAWYSAVIISVILKRSFLLPVPMLQSSKNGTLWQIGV